MTYGHAPDNFGLFKAKWHEYMHYLYLPVVMPEDPSLPRLRLPRNLDFMRLALTGIFAREQPYQNNLFVYITARRGYATPGDPLNRPGWHADGFGTNDVNYIWTDRYPTLFAEQTFVDISDDHVESIRQFEEQVEDHAVTYADRTLLRLDSKVVHAAPTIPAPGGDRGFFKVSLSTERYNLLGNSHNYLFNYDWKMWSRDEIRNDPAYAGGDAGPQRELQAA